MTAAANIDTRIRSLRWEAEGVVSIELVPAHPGAVLPAFTAGAHIDLHLAPGLVRSYSLTNAPGQTHRYCVAVNLDAGSRGGSRHVHERLHCGQRLAVSAPRNLFELNESAPRSRLIAGGIGITPLLCMARRLVQLGRPWVLHHASRSAAHAAFADELRALEAASGGLGRVDLHFDDERGGVLDVAAIVRDLAEGEHVYCCGPKPMLAAYEAATATLPRERVHLEYFSATQEAASAGGYRVRLARSGQAIAVAPGQTLLAAIQASGIEPLYSCGQGICGTCEARVLSGTPDHRDMVLSESERAAGDRMMICCSGSLTPELVLDL